MDSHGRHVRNREQPASVPVAPMGDVPVIVRVVWSDGLEEWRPARAVGVAAGGRRDALGELARRTGSRLALISRR